MTTASTLPAAAFTMPGRLHAAAGDAARTDAYLPAATVQCHAANLLALANGDLLCAWFGGTQEGVPDISIYCSRLEKGGASWSEPVRLSDDTTRSEQNPVLFAAPDGDLWLLYTAQLSGHQNTSIVRRRISKDQGRTWGAIDTLFDKPGTFVRQPIVVARDGAWLCPVFLCRVQPGERWSGNDDVSVVMRSTDGGATWSEHAVPDSVGCVHMNIQMLADGTLLALYRSRWADHIYASRSRDGLAWSAPEALDLPNNNSSIQFVTLANGHLGLVFNASSAAQSTARRASLYDDIEDSEDSGELVAQAASARGTAFWGAPRAPMTLAISLDGGRTWPVRRNLETGDGYCMTNNSVDKLNREFSYPSIAQSPDGRLHIAYTYFRQRIKYVSVTEDWASAAKQDADAAPARA
ncbi:sialidase family protein [Burkholderia glumae]|uniref:Exo-alpha-sialidase n=2 Tax=Burkholderia glumae TaxID=337 RepID=A0AAQ0BRJ9_BURGL|nr:BNR repeat-containing glycosyl hydrolase [Burkholderia glumae BGR1]MCR1767032.1 exo-alpha-sialidase [Burkholderia glumae]PNL05857.1 glycosyl hydrolase [Burkholderia glumae]QHP94113.1 glycosyl hydrolase [Burkholderia glumae]QJW80676.1 glycosyl hydrolase [Burkholderia glumae]